MPNLSGVVTVALLSLALGGVSIAQDKATAEEVVAKVREAARHLSQTGDVAEFNRKQTPWVWKDTYIFVNDCDKMVDAANPMKPELAGTPLKSINDAKGNPLFPDLDHFCEGARQPSGVWIEYWWPKPGDKQGSRKVSYNLAAKGTPYVVGAGIYDDKATIVDLSKQSSKK